MKTLILATCLIFSALHPLAQTYYISASDPMADDGNSGTTPTAPWKTFVPLNGALAVANSIDTVYLKRGDTFRDSIRVLWGNGIVFSAYGTGNKPIISGAEPVTGWTVSGSYYEAPFAPRAYNFFADNKEQIVARHPDDGAGYLTVDAATNNYLQDAALSAIGAAVLGQSQVCVHTAQWCWEKSDIASATSTQINYTTPTLRVPTANYGYFLYDHLNYLTTGKEWKYDAATQKIYYKPTAGTPNTQTCEASVRRYGIELGSNASNISVFHIAFEKQAESGIGILNAANTGTVVDSCYFARQYKYGVEIHATNATVQNSYFREVDGLAVFINSTGDVASVHHNTFRNNGGFRNSGIGQEINLSSIKGTFVDNCHIHHNDIDSAGYCGIAMDGTYNLIEKNTIKNAMLLNNDGAALKSFGVGSNYNTFRNNIISLGDGNTEGNPPAASHFITPAIYLDFSAHHCTIENNTIFDRTKRGIFLNSGTNNNTVIGNVVYGCNFCIDFNGSPIIPTPMTGMTVKRNALFAKETTSTVVRMVDNTGGFNQGTIDSNYYFQPYNANRYGFIPPTAYYTFTAWQTTTGFDAHTRRSFVTWTYPTAYDTLFTNPTDDVATYALSGQYLSLDSVEVCPTLTLQPYTSKILIKTNAACSALPSTLLGFEARAEVNQVACSWDVAQTFNLCAFILERSSDGIRWEAVAFIPAKGAGAYAVADPAPLPNVSYYRLQSMDCDGVTAYGPVRGVDRGDSTPWRVFPNPTSGSFALDFGEKSVPITIWLKDAQGRLVFQTTYEQAGVVHLDIEDPAGVYFLGGGGMVVRVVKR